MLRRLVAFAVVVAVLAGCGKATPQVSSLPTAGCSREPSFTGYSVQSAPDTCC